MCTVTWQPQTNGYILGFNRDEQRSREQASPPQQMIIDGCQMLAPIDRPVGGTWIAVNQYGNCFCLLNYYQANIKEHKQPFQSRGHLIKQLGHCQNAAELQQHIRQIDCSQYRGFQLLFLALQKSDSIVDYLYNGSQLIHTEHRQQCITSSSVSSQTVIPHRKYLFQQFNDTNKPYSIAKMRQFHLTTDDQVGARGVCMHRADAHTVSYTEIEVSLTAKNCTMRYMPSENFTKQTMTTSKISLTP